MSARPLEDHTWSIVRRLAGIVCPPQLDSPGRSQALRTQVELHLASLPRTSRIFVLAGFVAFDRAARLSRTGRGRRFVSLDDRHADAYLRGVVSSRHERWRELANLLTGIVAMCYYELPGAKRELGYDPDPYIADQARRRRERYGEDIRRAEEAVVAQDGRSAGQPRRHRRHARDASRVAHLVEGRDVDRDVDVRCDVVVVGSGAGGATFAAELADAGLDVVIVEEGPYRPTDSFTTDLAAALRTLYRGGGAQTAWGRPPITFLEGRCVGGSTVVNGGMSWPTPAHVLERWTDDEGVAAVTPAEMEPYFARVEQRLWVSPQDDESIGRDSELLKGGAKALGWDVIANRRAQVHCAGCNVCTLGCPTGAKRSMLVTNVPRALSRGARLYADCRVERISRNRKRATGVVGRFARPDGGPGPRLTVRAQVVVSACGAVQTPTLLARSGFASPSRQLGRNLSLHPNAKIIALFDEDVVGWKGVHQAFQVREFLGDGILIAAVNSPPSLVALGARRHGRALDELMREYNRMVVAGCMVEDSSRGRVDVVPRVGAIVRYQLSNTDARRIVRGIALTAEAMFAAGAKRVLLPFAGAPDLVRPAEATELARRLIPPAAMDVFTVHLMGTARMSDDRSRGVVSSFGEAHDARGLFVADASLLPGPVGVNPMETIMALALRNADQLIDDAGRFGL